MANWRRLCQSCPCFSTKHFRYSPRFRCFLSMFPLAWGLYGAVKILFILRRFAICFMVSLMKFLPLSLVLFVGMLNLRKICSTRTLAVVNAVQSIVGTAIVYFAKSQVAVRMYVWPSELRGEIGPTKSIKMWSQNFSPVEVICNGLLVCFVIFAFSLALMKFLISFVREGHL